MKNEIKKKSNKFVGIRKTFSIQIKSVLYYKGINHSYYLSIERNNKKQKVCCCHFEKE